ncbi:MAG: hypothetical protein HY704_05810 [Gemmatimonadetes bacterium]|nr:hypothetical protein [Gemmatimonadota bacterium]
MHRDTEGGLPRSERDQNDGAGCLVEKAIRKLRVVRATVRPDRRGEYLERWAEYRRQVEAPGGRAWLFEDEALPGRFIEFTEYPGAPGMEGRITEAVARARLARLCARREGEGERYREPQGAAGGALD